MLTDEEATRIIGATVVSGDGEEVGKVVDVHSHSADNRAAWATLEVEGRRVVVPLDKAHTEGDALHVRYDAELIAAAPDAEEDEIDATAADRLFEHYGIDDSELRDDSGFATDERPELDETTGDPRSDAAADDAAQGHP